MNMGDNALDAKSAEALLFVNMGDDALHAKSAEALLFVNMGDSALNAKSAEAVLIGNMDLQIYYSCLFVQRNPPNMILNVNISFDHKVTSMHIK